MKLRIDWNIMNMDILLSKIKTFDSKYTNQFYKNIFDINLIFNIIDIQNIDFI